MSEAPYGYTYIPRTENCPGKLVINETEAASRADDPVRRKRRYLCSRKETLHAGPKPCPNRTVQANIIEELVWQSVSELLRNPGLLIEQYEQRQEPGYGTPEQQEQQRLERRLAALRREGQRLIDAYQSGIIELSDLKERRERVSDGGISLSGQPFVGWA